MRSRYLKFSVEDAMEHGIECAIMLSFLVSYAQRKSSVTKMSKDGKTRCVINLHDWAPSLGFWNERKIFTILDTLQKKGLIELTRGRKSFTLTQKKVQIQIKDNLVVIDKNGKLPTLIDNSNPVPVQERFKRRRYTLNTPGQPFQLGSSIDSFNYILQNYPVSSNQHKSAIEWAKICEDPSHPHYIGPCDQEGAMFLVKKINEKYTKEEARPQFSNRYFPKLETYLKNGAWKDTSPAQSVDNINKKY